MKRPSNQAGFAVIELLLVLILLSILGFTGFYVVHARNSANKTLDTATRTATASTAKPTTKSTASAQADTKQTKYLVVKEWNVKVPLSASTPAVKYTLSADAKYAQLALDTTGDCSTPGAIGEFERVASSDPTAPTGSYVTELDGYSYTLVSPQSACSSNDNTQASATSARMDLVTALKSVTAVE
jgi:Tfp pilus assembly protein PilV